ncbi:acetyl-coenzyme A synthetase-like isoform X2 [Corticium candelabrum]|uniref:acetyl-coenzyme A synthetase-like isoform X2 n=1 Tax=Corticium candelabrum TaxID=121492 RepID=UPI002E259EF2|nr:acetyl-coenzyme A synthetase-like isoform X2 [Corticium candelabrum]
MAGRMCEFQGFSGDSSRLGAGVTVLRPIFNLLDLYPDSDPPLEKLLELSFQEGATYEEYQKLHSFSVKHGEFFWLRLAKNLYVTGKPLTSWNVEAFDSEDVDHAVKFMPGTKTNACYNLIDRNIKEGLGDLPALYYATCSMEMEEVTNTVYSYNDLLREVSKCSHVLQKTGIQPGDRVVIFLPDVPELVIFILACFRVGAVVVPVFSAASVAVLRNDIEISECKAVITANSEAVKGRSLKNICNEAVLRAEKFLKHIIVLDVLGNRSGGPMMDNRDLWFDEVEVVSHIHSPVLVDSEDPLFWARSSGTSSEPRMFEHRTLGFLVYMRAVFKYFLNFNVEEHGEKQDVCLCLASPAWIYGLQAMLLGPLLNGGATVFFNGLKQSATVVKNVIYSCGVTHLCSIPEFLMDFSKSLATMKTRRQLESLRFVSAAGSPFTVRAFDKVVGHFQSRDRSAGMRLADLWGQTEAGSYLFSTPPTSFKLKNSKNMLPFFGIDALVVDEEGRDMNASKRSEGELVVCQPWPCIFRRIIGKDTQIYLKKLLRTGFFFTGDRANRYPDQSFEFLGRNDNCVKVGDKGGVLQRRVQIEKVEEVLQDFEDGRIVERAYAAQWWTREGCCSFGLLVIVELNEESVPNGLTRRLTEQFDQCALVYMEWNLHNLRIQRQQLLNKTSRVRYLGIMDIRRYIYLFLTFYITNKRLR